MTGETMTNPWKNLLLGAVVLLGLLSACGGGTDRTKAQVRLVNASDYASLEWRVDDQVRQGDVAYGGSEAYLEIDPGKAATRISEPGAAAPLLSFTPAVSERRRYTLLSYGPLGTLRQQLLDDEIGEPADNRALLRVFNAAADAGALDVYLTGANDALDRAVALHSAVAYGTAAAPLAIDSGSWRLRVTAAGSKSDVLLDVPVVLGNRAIATLVLTPTSGGVLVRALVLAQRGPITRFDALQSRLRVAAGLTDNATVQLAFDPQAPLVAGLGSPALGLYAVVPSGSGAPTLAVNKQAVPVSAFDRMPGADYTLLVYGTPASPRTAWVADDNRLRTEPGKARLRLVNGLADLPAGGSLAVRVDGLQIASGVEPGLASAAQPVDATPGGTTNGTIEVAGPAGTVFSTTQQQLREAGVYSVFVLGRAASASGIVRRDR